VAWPLAAQERRRRPAWGGEEDATASLGATPIGGITTRTGTMKRAATSVATNVATSEKA
jgi:hypothetical protein